MVDKEKSKESSEYLDEKNDFLPKKPKIEKPRKEDFQPKKTPETKSEEIEPARDEKPERESETHKPYEAHPRAKSFAYSKVILTLGCIILLVLAYNSYQLFDMDSVIDKNAALAKEASRPADISIITLTANCPKCFTIENVLGDIKSSKVNIKDEKEVAYDSSEGKALIKKYGITKIPTIIVSGEIEKASLNQLKKSEDALVYNDVLPPYINPENDKVEGLVTVTHLLGCGECSTLETIVPILQESGVVIDKETSLSQEEATGLIGKYKIEKLPALILNKEAGMYDFIIENWDQVGTVEKDGVFILRNPSPPYYDVASKEVKGKVKLTILTDKSCKDCYDAAEFHKPIIQRMGVAIGEEKVIDVADASDLIKKYSIDKVPTIFMEGDVDEYSTVTSIWPGVGTVEKDGTYVFRSVEVSGGTYKHLSNGTVVTQEQTLQQ